MGEKFKVKDIEGSQEDVIAFFNQSGLDVSSYLNSSGKILIPFWSIVSIAISILIIASLILLIDNVAVKGVLTLLFVALSITELCLVYMSWKNKVLTGIIAFGELLLFIISLNIFTPKEIVTKIEDRIPRQENSLK